VPLKPLTGRHKGCGFFMLDIQLWDLENSWEPSKETGSFDMVTGVGRGIFFDGIRNRSEALFVRYLVSTFTAWGAGAAAGVPAAWGSGTQAA